MAKTDQPFQASMLIWVFTLCICHCVGTIMPQLIWYCYNFVAQPIGQPEICKMSLKASSVYGGEELFIIGKNFLRGTKVFFQELSEDENAAVQWEKESEIDRDYFQPVSDV